MIASLQLDGSGNPISPLYTAANFQL